MGVPAEPRPFGDVGAFEIGAGGQDHVGELGFPFHPDRLVDDEFKVGRTVGRDPAVGVGHGGDGRAAVLIEHPDRRLTRLGVDDLVELGLDGLAVPHVAFGLALEDRLGEEQARDLLARRIHGRQLRHALEQFHRHGGVFHVSRHAAFCVAREIEIEIDRRAPLQVAEVDARFAEPLHGHQADADPGPLDAGGIAACPAMAGAPAAGAEVGTLGAPFPRQGADVAGRNAGFLGRPFRRLGRAVVLAQDIGLPFIEPLGAGGDVVLVVEVLGNPDIGQGHAHGRRGGWLGGDPLAAQELGGVVEVGIDMHNLDVAVLQPLAAHGALERPIGARGRLRIGRPENDHLAILEAVFHGAVAFALADAQGISPMVRGAPIPAFPAVGIVMDLGMAHGVHEAEIGGKVIADIAPGVVGAVG